MELNEYQGKAMTTCMYTCDNFSYMFINLVEEVGEFASKVAKSIRKGEIQIGGNPLTDNNLFFTAGDEQVIEMRDEMKKEAGNILWQLAGLCSVMGWSLDAVAQENLDKLAARKEAGTIDGNGDGISGEDRK